MVQVVNKSQQVVTAGLQPASAYSRIMVVHAAAAGGGVYGYGVSQGLGQNFWLTKVDVTVQISLGGIFDRSHFSIHRGSVEPTRYQDVRDWDHLIDFGTYAGFRGMAVYGPWRQFSWNLSRRFTGETNRMAVLFYNAGVGTGIVHVFFTISEG